MVPQSPVPLTRARRASRRRPPLNLRGRSQDSALDHAVLGELLRELGAQARGVVGTTHQVVIRDAAELVVRARRYVRPGLPLAPLQGDVALLASVAHVGQQLVQPVTGGVLRA